MLKIFNGRNLVHIKFNEKQVKYTQQCTCIIRNLNVNKFNHCRVNSCCLQFRHIYSLFISCSMHDPWLPEWLGLIDPFL